MHKADVSHVYLPPWPPRYARIIAKRRLPLFVRRARFYLRVLYICQGGEIRAKNVLFGARGAAIKNHVGMFGIFARRAAAVFYLCFIVFEACLHAARPLALFYSFCAVFVFRLYVWHSLFRFLFLCFSSIFPSFHLSILPSYLLTYLLLISYNI